jgi:hypothetical protein
MARQTGQQFDWMPTKRTRDAEMERIIALGANCTRTTAPSKDSDGLREGNEFCVERSTAERDI